MFRTLLLDLSNALTSNDLSELKFICREEIPPGRAERITRPFEFFTALEQLNLLAEENRDFLAAKLIAINRNDLRNKLLGIQGGVDVEQSTQAGSRDDSPGIHNVPVSDRLIHEIVEDLSTSWKMLGRRLNLPESLLRNIDIENHRVVEKGVEMFTVWKERKGNDASVASLRKGLEKIGRRDLSEKVRDIITHEQESSVSVVEREHQGNPVQESHCLPDVEVASHVPLIQWPASDLPQPEEQVELYHLSLKQPTVPLQPVDGSPSAVCEERQSFPCLDDLDPALYVQQSQQQVVDQHYTALDSSLPVRLNRPSLGTEENIPDWPDGSTSMSAPIQVQSGRSLQLTVDGNYLDPEKYEPVKLIGSGGFAKVYLCTSTATGEQLAVKMIDLGMNDQETQKQVKNVSNEVKILASVKSDYIVKFHYSEECRNTLLIFLEYMPGGSIEMLLRHKGALQEPVVRKFTWQILNGVKFLHNKGIIHRDIKGGNILLDEAQDNIKIADFGISKIMNRLVTSTGGLKTNNKVVASFYWTSPELLSDKPFSRNTDIWSVGCTVVEMLTTLPPLLSQDLDLQQAMCKILQFEVRPPGDCSSEAYGFLEKCFCPQEKRPSASDLLENDPFAQYPVS